MAKSTGGNNNTSSFTVSDTTVAETTVAETTVEVIGAGPSGLFLAHALVEQGYSVKVFESSYSVGGMVQTLESPWGKIETAANAFQNSLELEALAEKLKVSLVPAKKSASRRYIFLKGAPRPVGPFSLGFFRGISLLIQYAFFRDRLIPRPIESVKAYGARVLGTRKTEDLLIPALQGVYAGDPNLLSATLLFSKFFRKREAEKPRKTHLGRTVAPALGMGSFFYALYEYVLSKGVTFEFGKAIKDAPPPNVIRIYTGNPSRISKSLPNDISMKDAERGVAGLHVVSLTSVALFFDEAPKSILPGFGVLFPRDGGIRSLGVLFNESIFPDRSPIHSETWILGGALDPEFHKLSDDEILRVIHVDREKCLGETISPKFSRIQRWPDAIPHFDLKLEERLKNGIAELVAAGTRDTSASRILFFGTFLGNLGIGGLLTEAEHFVGRLSSITPRGTLGGEGSVK